MVSIENWNTVTSMAPSARSWESMPTIKDPPNGMIMWVLLNYYTLQWRHNGRDGVSRLFTQPFIRA